MKWLVEGDQAGRSEGRLVHVGERELNQLREDLVRLDVDDLYRLREFLERWGLLGIGVVPVLNPSLADAVHFYGLSEYSWQGADDVAATRACLRELQRLAHGTDPDALPRLWEELEGATLCNVSVTVSRTGLEPRRTAWGLLGVIMLALPLWAKTQARRCGNERCSNLVIIPKKKFCSWECYNRFHVALSKKKARALRRLSQGESVSAVAKQHGLTPALVRQWQREKRQKKDPKPRRPKR